MLAGGRTLREGDLAHGYFVAPTVVDGLSQDHPLFREELFVPFLAVGEVDGFDWTGIVVFEDRDGSFTLTQP